MPTTIAPTRTGGTVQTGKCGWTRFGCSPSGNVDRVAVW
jgi:allophanate hydrolase subunit 2